MFNIIDNTLVKGTFPLKQQKLVEAWIEIHKEDLLANWEIAQNGELPFKIALLR